MNKKAKKLEIYLNKYLGQTPKQIIKEWGKPMADYDSETLCYNKFHSLLLRDEIIFFINDGCVTDIAISECILWVDIRNILYFKDENPKYKVINLLNWKKKTNILLMIFDRIKRLK